jgi:DNA-binding Lrp family transcriptional regulator
MSVTHKSRNERVIPLPPGWDRVVEATVSSGRPSDKHLTAAEYGERIGRSRSAAQNRLRKLVALGKFTSTVSKVGGSYSTFYAPKN